MHSSTPSMCQTHVLEKRLSVILVVCLFVCLAQNSWQHESWHKTDESTKHLVRTDSIITNESQSQKGKMYQLLSVYFMPLCTIQLNPPPLTCFSLLSLASFFKLWFYLPVAQLIPPDSTTFWQGRHDGCGHSAISLPNISTPQLSG